MMSKIDELVKARVDAEVAARLLQEKERLSHHSAAADEAPQDKAAVNSAPAAFDYSDELFQEQRPNMAKLVSDDFINVTVLEGKEVSLEFTVENKSTMTWPFKPFIQNEKDKSVKQIVDALLKPGDKTTCYYRFRAPLHQDQK